MTLDLLADVLQIYKGSNGDATRALYARLEACGPVGIVAMNLFRAQKASSRAKVYRGGIRGQGSFKSLAYERKEWSIDNLCRFLNQHARTHTTTDDCGPACFDCDDQRHREGPVLVWGWKTDPAAEFHAWVLYVDLPTGQVSFHTGQRGVGPAYAGEWDQVRDVATDRIVRYVAQVLDRERAR